MPPRRDIRRGRPAVQPVVEPVAQPHEPALPPAGVQGAVAGRTREEKPPVFRGSQGEDVEMWLEEFEQVATFNRWDDIEKRRSVVLCLQDIARDWYHSRIRPAAWAEFSVQIIGGFRNPNHQAELRRQLRTRVQQDEESPLGFCYAVDRLCTRVNPAMIDQERMQYMVDGLLPNLAAAILPFMAQREFTCEDFFRQVRVQSDLVMRRNGNQNKNTPELTSRPSQETGSRKRKMEPEHVVDDLRQKIKSIQENQAGTTQATRIVKEDSAPKLAGERVLHGGSTAEPMERGRSGVQCYNCGKRGHLARHCFQKQPTRKVFLTENNDDKEERMDPKNDGGQPKGGGLAGRR